MDDPPPPREKKARTAAAAPKAKNGYLSSDDEFDAMVKKETPEKKNGNGNANSDSDSEFGAPPPAKKTDNGNGKKKTNFYILLSPKEKFSFSDEATKIWRNLSQGFDINCLTSFLEDDCNKFLWPPQKS